jgi:adenine phosphoribosyltransferase
MKSMESYGVTIAGLKRDLPICPVSDDLSIAYFVIFGDVSLTKACASELLKKAPPHDIMITAESKGIPIIYEMARQNGEEDYLIARKSPKVNMKKYYSAEVQAITNASRQTL